MNAISAARGTPSGAVDPARLKTVVDVARIRMPAQRIAEVLQGIEPAVVAGITTAELELLCVKQLRTLGIHPILRGYRGFPADVSISVNEVAAHGVPNGRRLNDGDVVTIDLAVDHGGWKADAARSFAVGEANAAVHRLLQAAQAATYAGIHAARAGARFGDIGAAVEWAAAQHGCRVANTLCGHGIGRELHEPPVVHHTGATNTGGTIVAGLVFSIEPVVVLDTGEVTLVATNDGHGLRTLDLRPCAQFEQLVAVFADHTEVLTARR